MTINDQEQKTNKDLSIIADEHKIKTGEINWQCNVQGLMSHVVEEFSEFKALK